MLFTFFYFAMLLCYVCALFRNQRTYDVRVAFIYGRDTYPDAYHALPSYDAMAWHPKYWLLWTEADWRAWLARQQEVSAS